MYERHVAQIEVSPELLVKALHMPEGTEIFGVKLQRGTHGHVVILAVEHDDLPIVDESEVMPTVFPNITYHHESWEFDWNADVEHDLQMDDFDYPDPLDMEPYDS